MSISFGITEQENVKQDKILKRDAEEILRDAKKLKSHGRYEKAWHQFRAFHEDPTVADVTELMFLQYFDHLIKEKSLPFQLCGHNSQC